MTRVLNEEKKGIPLPLDKQAIFNALIANDPYSPEYARSFYFNNNSVQYAHQGVITRSLRALKRAELLTQKNQAAVIAAGEYAFEMGLGLELLSDANIPLTETIYFKLIKAGKHATELAKLLVYLERIEKAKTQQPSFFSWGSTIKISSSNPYVVVYKALTELKRKQIKSTEAILDVICMAYINDDDTTNFINALWDLQSNGVIITNDFVEIIANHIKNPDKISYIASGYRQLRKANIVITDKIREILFNKNDIELPFNFCIMNALIELNKQHIPFEDTFLDAIGKLAKQNLDNHQFSLYIQTAIKLFTQYKVSNDEVSQLMLNGLNGMLEKIEEMDKIASIESCLREKSIEPTSDMIRILFATAIVSVRDKIISAFDILNKGSILTDKLIKMIGALSFKNESESLAKSFVELSNTNTILSDTILNAITAVEDDCDKVTVVNAFVYVRKHQLELTDELILKINQYPHSADGRVKTIVEIDQECKQALAMIEGYGIVLSDEVKQAFNDIRCNATSIADLYMQLKKYNIPLADQFIINLIHAHVEAYISGISESIASIYNLDGSLTPCIMNCLIKTDSCSWSLAIVLILLGGVAGIPLRDDLVSAFYDGVKVENESNIGNALLKGIHYIEQENKTSEADVANVANWHEQSSHLPRSIIDVISEYLNNSYPFPSFLIAAEEKKKHICISIPTAEFLPISNDEVLEHKTTVSILEEDLTETVTEFKKLSIAAPVGVIKKKPGLLQKMTHLLFLATLSEQSDGRRVITEIRAQEHDAQGQLIGKI